MFNTKQINIVVHPPSCIRLLLLSLGGDPGNLPGMFFYTGESSIRTAASALLHPPDAYWWKYTNQGWDILDI